MVSFAFWYLFDLGKDYFTGKLNLFFFSFKPEILEKLFNSIYCLILTPTLTRTRQLSPKPNRKPHIKCTRMNIA